MKETSGKESVPTLDDVFDRASTGNEVLVTHSDGNIYAIRNLGASSNSAFDRLGIPHIENNLTVDEIVQIVREGRERIWDSELKRFVWPEEEGYAALAKDMDNHQESN